MEPIASDASELAACGCNQDSYLEFEATNGTSVFGPSTSTHVCWPTIYGPRSGSSMPLATVTPTACNQGGCTWKATGDVTMTCVPQCCFGSNGGNQDVRWLSETFIAVASITGSATVAEKKVDMWKGDAMAIASGLFHSGASPMRRFDDFGYLTSSGPNKLDALTAREIRRSGDASPLQTAAYAYSFFVGKPGGTHVVRKKSYFVAGSQRIDMISPSSGICTLGSVSGVRADGYPRIYQSGSVWRADWIGANPGEMSPICYYFAQDQ
jgi:hypothetical protein